MPITHSIGIDEVGRGSLAGPLGVGWCMVPSSFDMTFFVGIRDSKKLSEKKRNAWAARIAQHAHISSDRTPSAAMGGGGKKETSMASVASIASGVVYISAQEIDAQGISTALLRAVAMALQESAAAPESTQVLLDGGLRAPAAFVHQTSIIRGDDTEPLISAASVVAKVARDAHMTHLHEKYPEYGFAQHKGYGTAMHRAAIAARGMCAEHRKSFCGNIVVL